MSFLYEAQHIMLYNTSNCNWFELGKIFPKKTLWSFKNSFLEWTDCYEIFEYSRKTVNPLMIYVITKRLKNSQNRLVDLNVP